MSCPNCGYCPACGRGAEPVRYNPDRPCWPYQRPTGAQPYVYPLTVGGGNVVPLTVGPMLYDNTTHRNS